MVNKILLPCFLGCRNCLHGCTSTYSFKCSAVAGHHTQFYRPHRYTTFSTPQQQLSNITQIKKQIKPAGKIPKQKIMLNVFIYPLFLFAFPHGKIMPCSNAGKPKRWNAKQQGLQNKTHRQQKVIRKKKAKPKSQRNYRENFSLSLSMIGYKL